MTIAVLILLLLVILVIFTFPQFSPVPYYPTNKKDILIIIEALGLRNNQTVFDLGAGDGIVVFEAARMAVKHRLNTTFVALEINPILVFILHLRRLFHPNRNRISVIWADMFKIPLSKLSNPSTLPRAKPSKPVTIFIYISPWLIEKLVIKLKKEFNRFEVVSYFYPLPKSTVVKKAQKIKGVNSLYKYVHI